MEKQPEIANPTGPEKRGRRSIRLKDYDYAEPGRYFVTICTHGRTCRLGEVEEGTVRLSLLGQVAEHCWRELPQHFPGVEMDAFIVMPNHLHGVIVINQRSVGAKDWTDRSCYRNTPPCSQSFAPTVPAPVSRPSGTQPGSLPAIIQTFKSVTTRKANRIDRTPGGALWQRNYYEHVIRNDQSLDEIRQYILANPWMWPKDKYYVK